MNDFSPFDLRAWAENGLTFPLRTKRIATQGRNKKDSSKIYFLSALTLAAAVALAPQTIEAKPSQVLLNWRSTIDVPINGSDDHDAVSTTYWPKLVTVVNKAPRLPDDDYSSDPDPIF